ncbi:MAG: TonB-dependent receptor [Deltaproteobacteria bacterium]|nr:TonB-dependent receptor [Deltaproteobacteria bacterium]
MMTSTPFRLALQRCLLACLWLALPLGGGGGFAPAHAQEAQEDEEASDAPEWIEEIVVTATKRETDLMATPLAVTALGQDALNREGVQDALDLASLVPNMQVGHSPSDSGVQVTVRGITSNNFTELGDPAVGIHVDGMYSPRPQGGLALMHDVERVEILRGPQGTLFGRNSTSGAVNIITARPDFTEMSGMAEVELGKFEHKLARGWFNLPLLEDVALRASFMVDKTDSYIHQDWDRYDLQFDANGDGDFDDLGDIRRDGVPQVDQRRAGPVDDEDAYGNSNRWAYRVSALWQPSTYFKWLFSYDHYQDNGAGNISLKDCEKAAGTFFACEHPQYYTNVNVPGRIDMSIATFRSELVWDMPWITVEYRFAFGDQDRFQQYDGDGGFYTDPDHPAYGFTRPEAGCGTRDEGGVQVPNCPALPPVVRDADTLARIGFPGTVRQPWTDLQLTTRWSNYESDVHELQFKGDFDVVGRQLRWIAGFFDLREKNAIRFDVENPFCCEAVRPLAQAFVQPDRQITSTAVFAQFDYQVSEQLNLTFGYRYTEDEKNDNGGGNYVTTGAWLPNPNFFQDPNQPNFRGFWSDGYYFVGRTGATGAYNDQGQLIGYQADNLLPNDGSLAENFPARLRAGNAVITDNTASSKWSKSTWRAGADYLVHEDLFVYGYVATGYKAGGFGDNVDPDGGGPALPTTYPYDPEENITYEIGVKNTLLDGKLNLIANLFYSDYEDMQRTQWVVVGRERSDFTRPPGPGNEERDIGTLLTTNLAAAQILGLEFEFDWWELWPGGRVFGWISWLDTEITYPDGDDGWFCPERALLGLTPCPAEDTSQRLEDNSLRRPTNFTGNKLPWSPEWSMTINFEHNWYLPGGQRISPFLSVSFVDEYFFNDNNFDEGAFHSGQTAIATMNFSLRYINEEQRWGAEIYVYNLTDELVRTWSDPGPGYLRANFAPPRSYGIKMRKDF